MTKINIILLVKRFYFLSVDKVTLQVIFNEDPFDVITSLVSLGQGVCSVERDVTRAPWREMCDVGRPGWKKVTR